jgi:hypothetical protein
MALFLHSFALVSAIVGTAAQDSLCSIGDVFGLLNEIKQNDDCMAGCNSGSGDCPPEWIPGTADVCTAECGRVFEPFWDTCGDLLVGAQMGGMDGLETFYDKCLTELYPPGACGTFCNGHTYDCFVGEVQSACCDEGGANCPAGQPVPNACPVGCALVFPQFLDTCRDHLQSDLSQAGDISLFDNFADTCVDLDGMELVEYAAELMDSGCSISLPSFTGHRRQMQGYLANRFGGTAAPSDGACNWDQVDDAAAEVDRVCCGPDGSLCRGDASPTQCSPSCAVTFHSFSQNCAATVDVVLGPTDPMREQMQNFERTCADTAQESSEVFMEAILNAQCPSDNDVRPIMTCPVPSHGS